MNLAVQLVLDNKKVRQETIPDLKYYKFESLVAQA